ncbi:helix-turn-helix domain-containing protein [Streptomyces sp. NPDC056269]|uniref:helix-turn-helix domain-containing protein n=1 Tax=Streptomyces sp. NPDC056269 TaxID=3345768 RepID=UPI0035D75489
MRTHPPGAAGRPRTSASLNNRDTGEHSTNTEASVSGRPHKPIPGDAPGPVRELAELLRRVRAGHSLRELSRITNYSLSVLSEATSGRRVPSWPVVEALAKAGMVSPDRHEGLRDLWNAAKAAEADRSAAASIGATASGEPPPRAHEVMESAAREMQQRTVLHALYELADRPSVRDLADATGLSRSAVHRVVTGQSTAGAERVAEDLATRLAPEQREDWTARVTHVFDGAPTLPQQAPLYYAHTVDALATVAEAFSEFEKSLKRVRNLVAHGVAIVEPEVGAQIMLLASTVELTRGGQDTDSMALRDAEGFAAMYRRRVNLQHGALPAGGSSSEQEDQT